MKCWIVGWKKRPVQAQTTALDVAQAVGLEVRPRGTRSWMCCPIHGEKTPSLCFFPDGRWHCFGCQAGGDAADLYAVLHNVPLGEALRAVRGEEQRDRQPTKAELAQRLRRRAEDWKAEQWREAFQEFDAARLARMALEDQHPPGILLANDPFWDILQREAKARDLLNLLETATPKQLLQMMGGTS